MNLTGEITQRLVVALPDETKAALAELDISVPQEVVFELREATLREREQFQAAQDAGLFTGTDALDKLAELLLKRAVQTEHVVLRELLRDMTPAMQASLVTAYITGELPDPKVAGAVLRKTQSGLMHRLMTALAEQEPFSAPSTESSLGKSAG